MRLPHPDIVQAGNPVRFSYDGQVLEGLAGETIAAALAANGINLLRHTRSGQRRGLYCGMGACFECLVTVDGRASQRACLTKLTAGQTIRSRAPSATLDDPLMPLAPRPDRAAAPEHIVDVLVIGAGPAGLAAALAARRRGASVTILDERPQSGGQFYKPVAPSYETKSPLDRQFAEGTALVDAVRRAGVTIQQDAIVWGAHARDEVVAIVAGAEIVYRPRQLIIAAGAYERPAPFPGWTLPGVMTTGAAQTLARAYRVSPGRRVLIAGNGPLNLQLACELIAGGVDVIAVLESAARPTARHWRELLLALRTAPDLIANGLRYLWRLLRARVPVLWSHTVLSAEGGDCLRQIRYAPLDGDGRANSKAAVTVDVDTLCLGYGFTPSTEIARALGCRHRLIDRHLGYLATETAEDGSTDIPGVYAIGDGADIGGSRVALARGALAGVAVARNLGFIGSTTTEEDQTRVELRRAQRFQDALWSLYRAPPLDLRQVSDDAVLCRCEEIDFGRIRREIAAGHDTLGVLKRVTRLGMGRCQGRYCAASAALLIAQMTGRPRTEEQYFAPRLPVKPVPAGALAFEKPEWGGHTRAITPDLARPADTAPLPDQDADILIIGGGVVGACLAYYLSQEGQDVLVVERDDANLQASGANAGSLHVQLLSFDFGAKAESGGGPAAATLPLGPISVRLWQELESACGENLEIRISGGFMVANTDDGMRFLAAKAALERQHGIAAEIIGAAELRRLSPALSDKLVGAEFCPQEGKINPLLATHAVLGKARQQGARFLRGMNVTAIRRAGATWDVETSRCHIRAGRIVNASGAWSSEIGRMIGIDIPVHGAPLQMIVTEPAPKLIDHLVAHADRHLSLKQVAAGGLVIGGGWTAAFDPRRRFNMATRPSIEGNLWVATHVLPQLAGLHVIRSWAGMNVNIDGAPIIGAVPGQPGFYNAVTSNGYTLAPVVARLTTDLLLRGRTDIDVRPYLIDRFQ